MATIVESEASQVEVFQSALGGGATVLSSLDQLDEHLANTTDEYVVVLGPSVNLDSATSTASHYRIARPSLGVILVRSRIDSNVLSAALLAGMRQVVESRDLAGLSEAVRSAYQVWSAMQASGIANEGGSAMPRARGRLVTVFSTKGGVGKTTVCTNLAAALASQGQSVCVVDLDVSGGDVALMLQLFPTRTLSDLDAMGGALDSNGARSLVTEHSENLSVIAAPLSVDGRERVSPNNVAELLQVLKREYSWIISDTCGTFDEFALASIDHTDVLLMVGSLDIPSLKNLKLAAGTLDLLNLPRSNWRLLLNRADAKVGLTQEEFVRTLGIEITAAIPSSVDVLASVNAGTPLVISQPRHEISKTFDRLSDELMDTFSYGRTDDADGASPSSPASAPRRRLLRRK